MSASEAFFPSKGAAINFNALRPEWARSVVTATVLPAEPVGACCGAFFGWVASPGNRSSVFVGSSKPSRKTKGGEGGGGGSATHNHHAAPALAAKAATAVKQRSERGEAFEEGESDCGMRG